MNLEIAGEWVTQAAQIAWNASGAASVLVVLVAVLTLTLGKKLRASWRFALWCVVLARLFLPFTPESALSVFNVRKFLLPKSEPPVAASSDAPPSSIQLSHMDAPPSEIPEPIPLETHRGVDWALMLAVISTLGTLVLLIRLLAGALWLQMCLRHATSSVDAKVLNVLHSARKKLGTHIHCRVTLSNQVHSPALFGFLRPTLLIPVGFEDRLTPAEQEFVFLHELAHLKRRDLIINFLMTLAQAIHWWNPLVWLTMRQMRLEREIACDEMVVGSVSAASNINENARAYGETILRLIESAAHPKFSVVGIAEDKHSARKRLEHLSRIAHQKSFGRLLSTAILAILVITGLSRAQTNSLKSTNRGESISEAVSTQTPINSPGTRERTFASPGRQGIITKLQQIKIDHYEVPNPLPLSEIIKDLYATARRKDPGKKGVNILFSSRLENPEILGSVPQTDPLTGAPPLKVGDYLVKISPALRDVTLLGLLDAIMEVAEPPKSHSGAPPLRYAIEDYAIIIGQRRYEAEPLYTRTFKIDPNNFIHGLDGTFRTDAVHPQNATMQIQRALQRLMVNAGVDFGTNTTADPRSANGAPAQNQKAIFFNDKTGVLMARATLSELNLVEKALQKLNSVNQLQILFTVEAVEVTEPRTLNEFMQKLKLAGEVRTRFTDPQFRELRRETAANFKWISLPQVTTVSGRAARVEFDPRFGVDVLAEYAAAEKPIKLRAASYDVGQRKPDSKEALIYDGETVALIPFADDEKVQPPWIMFVTATLIDAAGNRVNLPDEETQNTLP